MLHFVIFNKEQICIQNVKNKFWAEVDYIESYERILRLPLYVVLSLKNINEILK